MQRLDVKWNVVDYQILDDLDASMHYQIKYEYNATATYSNRTDTDVHRITTAWDTLQVQVSAQ